jgi:Tfp pilus assembly protein PilZ
MQLEPVPPLPPPPERRPRPDLMALIDEELVDEPRGRPLLTRVEVNVSLVSEHNFFVGQTRRLDSGGVFISTALPPPVGTRLQLRLGLPDGRKIDLEGEVAFIREKSAITGRQPSGCGVRLVNLPAWAVDAIDRFLMARPPIVYAAR